MILAELDLGNATTPWQIFVAVLYIVVIDVVLAGDNAVVIAMAVRNLPATRRKLGILLGGGVAVALRVGLTMVAVEVLDVHYIKLVGGALILWIAVKLLLEDSDEDHAGGRKAKTVWQAMWMVMVADVTMSLDNVLAVAGASRGHFGLVLLGLGLSIPLVLFASNLLSNLMNRFPLIAYLGAAVLGRVGMEMILTDRLVREWLPTPGWLKITLEIGAAIAVVLVALGLKRSRRPADARDHPEPSPRHE